MHDKSNRDSSYKQKSIINSLAAGAALAGIILSVNPAMAGSATGPASSSGTTTHSLDPGDYTGPIGDVEQGIPDGYNRSAPPSADNTDTTGDGATTHSMNGNFMGTAAIRADTILGSSAFSSRINAFRSDLKKSREAFLSKFRIRFPKRH